MKIVSIVSGGLDSVSMLYIQAKYKHNIHVLSFDYGQRHKKELDYAKQAAYDIGGLWDCIDLSSLTHLIGGSSLTDDIPVPDGHYAEENMKVTVVPNRNAIMLSIAYGVAVGPARVTILNDRLQDTLNPAAKDKPERRLFGTVFRLGDKVMQTRNNYDLDVYNGDIGFIHSLDPVDQTLAVDFDGRKVSYEWSEADELALAYVVSVHKAQGSEFPAVVMPVVTQHYTMLQRNLLYTAITLARRLCVLAGSRKAIGMAVHNNKVTRRFTALDWRLKHDRPPGLP